MHEHPPWFWAVAAVLAVWRLAHLIAREDGPFDVVVRLRRRAGDGAWGRLMDCPYCLSQWLAAPAAGWLGWRMGADVPATVVLWLALSGGACLIERLLPPLQSADLLPSAAFTPPPDPAPAPLVMPPQPMPGTPSAPAPHDERKWP